MIADIDIFFLQLLIGLQCLKHSDAGGDDRRDIILSLFLSSFRAADRELSLLG